MSIPAVFFKGLLKTLAGQLIDQNQEYAECIGNDFGSQINQNAKLFFSIAIIEEELPRDLAAIGVLVDNRGKEFKGTGYTFFIYIDSSKKHEELTEDLRTIFKKMVLSHEICHFTFYLELFYSLGADLTSTVYTKFQNIVSGKLEAAITKESNITNETVVEEHMYGEFFRNFWVYPNTHYDKKKLTSHDYNVSNEHFFIFLTQK